MAKAAYEFESHGTRMIHKTKLKCIINPILRGLQFYTWEPYVIVSIFENNKFIKYGIMKMKYKLG